MRSPESRWQHDDGACNPFGALGELAAVHLVGGNQRLCRRRGRGGAVDPGASRWARLPHREPGGDPLLPDQLWPGQSRQQFDCGPARRSPGPSRGLAGGMGSGVARSGAHHLCPVLGLGGLCECLAGCQPGPGLVDNSEHEDRPRRAAPAWARPWLERSLGLPGRVGGCGGRGIPRGHLRDPARSLLTGRDPRRLRLAALPAHPRDRTTCRTRIRGGGTDEAGGRARAQRELPRSHHVQRVPSGDGEQPQRRHGLGAASALLRGSWARASRDRAPGRSLSRGLGRWTARHRVDQRPSGS